MDTKAGEQLPPEQEIANNIILLLFVCWEGTERCLLTHNFCLWGLDAQVYSACMKADVFFNWRIAFFPASHGGGGPLKTSKFEPRLTFLPLNFLP